MNKIEELVEKVKKGTAKKSEILSLLKIMNASVAGLKVILKEAKKAQK